MSNAYLQVARTYHRRVFASRTGLLALLAGIGWLYEMLSVNPATTPAFMILQTWLALNLMAGHVKDQSAGPQVHLVPHFGRVHTAVGIAVLAILALIHPAVAAGWWGLRSVGLASVTVGLLAFTLWGTAMNWSLIRIAPAALLLAATTGPLHETMSRLISGQAEPMALELLALGIAGSIAGGWRLVDLRAGTIGDEFRQSAIRSESGKGMEVSITPAAIANDVPDRSLERRMARAVWHARHAVGSRWSQVCRWRIESQAGTYLWFVAIAVIALVWLIDAFAFPRSLGFMMPCAILLPPALSGKRFQNRLMFGYESLLPVERAKYAQEVGLLLAVDHARCWGVITGIAVLETWMTASESLSASAIAMQVAVSALLQVWFFGVRIGWERYLPQFSFSAVMFAAPFFLASLMQERIRWIGDLQAIGLGVAAILAFAGVIVTWAACQSWLAADLE